MLFSDNFFLKFTIKITFLTMTLHGAKKYEQINKKTESKNKNPPFGPHGLPHFTYKNYSRLHQRQSLILTDDFENEKVRFPRRLKRRCVMCITRTSSCKNQVTHKNVRKTSRIQRLEVSERNYSSLSTVNMIITAFSISPELNNQYSRH